MKIQIQKNTEELNFTYNKIFDLQTILNKSDEKYE